VKTGPRGRAGIESILTQSGVPVGVAAFIGRGRDRAKVADLLAETRVVTLTGSGGCGKTRLAMLVSGDVAARFTDGVRWVDLQTVSEPGRVAPTVAEAVAVTCRHLNGVPLAIELAAACVRVHAETDRNGVVRSVRTADRKVATSLAPGQPTAGVVTSTPGTYVCGR